MELHEINPHIRFANRSTSYLMEGKYRVCYDCRLFYIEKGNGSIRIENEKYVIVPNTVMFLPPASHYRFSFDAPRDLLLYVFDFDLTDRFAYLSSSLGTAKDDNYDPSHVPRYELPADFEKPIVLYDMQLSEPLQGLTNTFQAKEAYYHESSSALLKYTLFEILCARLRSVRGPNYDTVRRVTDYIRIHFTEIDLSNASIAAHFGYHPYYLSTLIKEETGKTLRQYLISCRVSAARSLLCTTDDDIGTVAWKSGFGSASYFIKVFREQTGLTPARFRQNNVNFI